MSKSVNDMKELVMEWSKYWGYSVTDIKEKQKEPLPIEWILEIKNVEKSVTVYTDKQTPDILRFQTKIVFSPEHRQKTVLLPTKDYNNFILETTDRLVNLGCDWVFEHDEGNSKQMNSLNLFYFAVYNVVDKNHFLQTLNKCFIHISQMVRAISIPLNKMIETDSSSKESIEKVYV